MRSIRNSYQNIASCKIIVPCFCLLKWKAYSSRFCLSSLGPHLVNCFSLCYYSIIFKVSFSTRFSPKAFKLYKIFPNFEKKILWINLKALSYSLFSLCITIYCHYLWFLTFHSLLSSSYLILFYKNYIQRGTNVLFDAKPNVNFFFFIFFDVSALKILFFLFLWLNIYSIAHVC